MKKKADCGPPAGQYATQAPLTNRKYNSFFIIVKFDSEIFLWAGVISTEVCGKYSGPWRASKCCFFSSVQSTRECDWAFRFSFARLLLLTETWCQLKLVVSY